MIHRATTDDIILLPRAEAENKISTCYEPLSYVAHPELLRLKYVRVNIHFMNSSDGRYNMPEGDEQ